MSQGNVSGVEYHPNCGCTQQFYLGPREQVKFNRKLVLNTEVMENNKTCVATVNHKIRRTHNYNYRR